ncbi:hypothetical protein FB567DRAFT_513885 [Paraphoma chrysanthemicola]|uniref:Uncharacterized protein n=1 Tax=Paraphoma chrysanthemicola TaxID=798071 RepID=A0A8K0RK44_9PLEO|nr:hypothetical protein FB567DRAFT_513885 [Paraphoma chrysanthemicola]
MTTTRNMGNANRYTTTNAPPIFHVPLDPPQSPILYTTQPSSPNTSYQSPSSLSSSTRQHLATRTQRHHQRYYNVQSFSQPRLRQRPQWRPTTHRAPRVSRSLDSQRSNMLLAQLRRNRVLVRDDFRFHDPMIATFEEPGVVTFEERIRRLTISSAIEHERQQQQQPHGESSSAEMQGIEESMQNLAIEARESEGHHEEERREEEAHMSSLLYGVGGLGIEEGAEVQWIDEGYEETGLSATESVEEEDEDGFDESFEANPQMLERRDSAYEPEMDEQLLNFVTSWQS